VRLGEHQLPCEVGEVLPGKNKAKPVQPRPDIEQATAVRETNVATALMGCMTKP
jgi:hypothetical protein